MNQSLEGYLRKLTCFPILRHANGSWGYANDVNRHKQSCVMLVKIAGESTTYLYIRRYYAEVHPSKLTVTRYREPGAHFF